jgi:Ca2+/Na+ antiporter
MVLAPLLSILILYISMIFDRAIIKNKNNEMLAFYLIGTIIASFSINVYNFDIFIQLMFQYVLPLYLLIKFNTKKNMSYNPVINNVSLISNQRPLNNC